MSAVREESESRPAVNHSTGCSAHEAAEQAGVTRRAAEQPEGGSEERAAEQNRALSLTRISFSLSCYHHNPVLCYSSLRMRRITALVLLAVGAVHAQESAAIDRPALGLALENATQDEERALDAARPNHKVCYEILDMWWNERLSEKMRSAVTTMDVDCEAWNSSPLECNNRAQRTRRSGVTDAQMNAFCTNVGAHSPDKCVANPCASLNEGTDR